MAKNLAPVELNAKEVEMREEADGSLSLKVTATDGQCFLFKGISPLGELEKPKSKPKNGHTQEPKLTEVRAR